MENLAINDFLEQFLKVSPDFITVGVVIICALLFIFSLFPKFSRWRDISPALMISAGIIGTFWGTFIALADFETGADHKTMVESIPKVLGGMKTAFITSLIGLLAAFISKIFFKIYPESDSVESETLDLLKKIKNGIAGELGTIKLLEEIRDGIASEKDNSLSSQLSALRTEYRDGMKDLKQSITGAGDSSIATQLIKLRNENIDGFKKLDEHTSGIAEQFTKLRSENVDEFKKLNEHTSGIAEQFTKLRSENVDGFKKLDEHMNKLAEIIRDSLVKSIQELIKELREVIAEQLVEQLKETNKVLSTQLEAMLNRIEEALINQFGETFKQFNEATQAIKAWQAEHRQHVIELTEAFKMTATGIEKIRADCEAIPNTMEQLKALIGEIDGHLKELDERLKAFANMKEAAEQSFPVIKKKIESMIDETRNASNAHQDQIREIITNVNTEFDQTRRNLTTITNQHTKAIEDLMKQITDRWGENMLGLAQRMAEVINVNNNNQQ